MENIAPGMTMVLNQKAHDELIRMDTENSLLHDWWTYLVCAALGKVIYDSNVTVKYRRHLGNVTTVEQGIIDKIIWRFKTFLASNYWIKLKKQLTAFDKNYSNKLDKKKHSLLKLFCCNLHNLHSLV